MSIDSLQEVISLIRRLSINKTVKKLKIVGILAPSYEASMKPSEHQRFEREFKAFLDFNRTAYSVDASNNKFKEGSIANIYPWRKLVVD